MIEYVLSLLVIVSIWVLLTQSYNLSFGLTGLFNLGHIIFYGIGAYTAAILNTQHGVGFFGNILFAAAICGAVAAVFGLLTLRLSGHYLAIATLGAAMIATVVATNWMDLTNGPLGIRGIDGPTLFGYEFTETWSILLLFIIVTGACLWVLRKIFTSPYGRLLRAIQDDEIAVKAIGKDAFTAKTWSLILSAAFAGIAGVMYSHYRLFLDPTIFALPEIILLILMVIVGGRGNFWGVVWGTVLVIVIGELPRFFGFPDSMVGAARNLLFAALLVITMFSAPKGLFTLFEKKRKI